MAVSRDPDQPFVAVPKDLQSLNDSTNLRLGILTDLNSEIVDVVFKIEQPSNAQFRTSEIVVKNRTINGPGSVVDVEVQFAKGSGVVRLVAEVIQNNQPRFSSGTALSLPIAGRANKEAATHADAASRRQQMLRARRGRGTR